MVTSIDIFMIVKDQRLNIAYFGQKVKFFGSIWADPAPE